MTKCWMSKGQADLAVMCLTMLLQLVCSLFQCVTCGLCRIVLSQSCGELLLKLRDKTGAWTLGKDKLGVTVQVLQGQQQLANVAHQQSGALTAAAAAAAGC